MVIVNSISTNVNPRLSAAGVGRLRVIESLPVQLIAKFFRKRWCGVRILVRKAFLAPFEVTADSPQLFRRFSFRTAPRKPRLSLHLPLIYLDEPSVDGRCARASMRCVRTRGMHRESTESCAIARCTIARAQREVRDDERYLVRAVIPSEARNL